MGNTWVLDKDKSRHFIYLGIIFFKKLSLFRISLVCLYIWHLHDGFIELDMI